MPIAMRIPALGGHGFILQIRPVFMPDWRGKHLSITKKCYGFTPFVMQQVHALNLHHLKQPTPGSYKDSFLSFLGQPLVHPPRSPAWNRHNRKGRLGVLLTRVQAFPSSFSGNLPPRSPFPSSKIKPGPSSPFLRIVLRLLKVIGGAVLVAALAIASLPWALSWSRGRDVALSLYNRTIPGSVSVASASLEWRKPVHVEGIRLKGPDGQDVVTVDRFETEAPLWTVALGRSGLGGLKIVSPTVDLVPDEATGLTPLDRALQSPAKLSQRRHRPKPPAKRSAPHDTTAYVRFQGEAKAPGGSLTIHEGRMRLPGDAVAVLGDRLVGTVLLGELAVEEDQGVAELAKLRRREVPLVASVWSECTHMQMAGTLGFRAGEAKLQMVRPAKVEMDLRPAVGQLFLARINPLLADVAGPAVKEEDMPDLTLTIMPAGGMVPAEQYTMRLEPMRVVLLRGSLVEALLSLVTERPGQGRAITMETSVVQTHVDMDGTLDCDRIDVLIAGGVHVATWGRMDWLEGSMDMVVGLPEDTLRRYLRLTRLPQDYFLQVPVSGAFEKPRVDLKKVSIRMAELAIQQRTGVFTTRLFGSEVQPPIPKPLEPLPWER